MKTYFCVVLLAALLVLPAAFAFSMTVPSDNVQLSTGATRHVTITLRAGVDETIVVSLVDAQPWTSLTDVVVKAAPQQDATTTLVAAPPIGTATGIYRVRIIAESISSGERVERDIFFSLSRGEVLDIESTTVTGNLQPTGEVSVSVTVDNSRTTTVQGAELELSVSGREAKVFEATHVLGRIDPGQKATEEFAFGLPPGAAAGEYTVVAKLEHGRDTRTVTQPFFVARKAMVALSEKRFPLIFGYGKTITARNNGNAEGDALVQEDLSGFESAFYVGPEPVSTEPFVWELSSIPVLGEKSITYRIDFAPLFALLIAIIVVGWVIFFRLRTVRIRKYIMQKKFLAEGEEFTVGIDVRNASGGKIDEVVVRDFVPTMFEIKHAHGPKPAEKKVVGGRELIWRISDFYNREERVLTYKMIPIFGVSGGIRLPPARVTYKWRNREMTHLSFSPRIGVAEPVEEESVLKRFGRKRRS